MVNIIKLGRSGGVGSSDVMELAAETERGWHPAALDEGTFSQDDW